MAQISDSGGGGKKSLNPDINLVPFIDLLSVCICFLLIAAVWLQVGTVQVKQSYGTQAPDTPKDTYELVLSLAGPTQVKLDVMRGHQRTASVDVDEPTKDKFTASLGSQLDAQIATLTGGNPNVSIPDLITAATINPTKSAPYGSLIAVMDVLRKHQIVNLAVTPKAG